MNQVTMAPVLLKQSSSGSRGFFTSPLIRRSYFSNKKLLEDHDDDDDDDGDYEEDGPLTREASISPSPVESSASSDDSSFGGETGCDDEDGINDDDDSVTLETTNLSSSTRSSNSKSSRVKKGQKHVPSSLIKDEDTLLPNLSGPEDGDLDVECTSNGRSKSADDVYDLVDSPSNHSTSRSASRLGSSRSASASPTPSSASRGCSSQHSRGIRTPRRRATGRVSNNASQEQRRGLGSVSDRGVSVRKQALLKNSESPSTPQEGKLSVSDRGHSSRRQASGDDSKKRTPGAQNTTSSTTNSSELDESLSRTTDDSTTLNPLTDEVAGAKSVPKRSRRRSFVTTGESRTRSTHCRSTATCTHSRSTAGTTSPVTEEKPSVGPSSASKCTPARRSRQAAKAGGSMSPSKARRGIKSVTATNDSAEQEAVGSEQAMPTTARSKCRRSLQKALGELEQQQIQLAMDMQSVQVKMTCIKTFRAMKTDDSKLRYVFKLMDDNQCGHIDVMKLMNVMGSIFEDDDEYKKQDLIDTADGYSKLSYEEFASFVQDASESSNHRKTTGQLLECIALDLILQKSGNSESH